MDTFCCEYGIADFVSAFSPLPQNKFSLLHINCQSLRNKFDSFSLFIDSLDIRFDVLCVTETWLYDNELPFFRLDGYTFLGTQRNTRGGGAGAFVRCGLDVKVLAAEVGGADVHSFDLAVGDFSKQQNIRVTVIYRQPSTDVNSFLHDLEPLLSSLSSSHIITGDINIDMFNKQVSENYLSLISMYNFNNYITISTHFSKSHKKWSCIDHTLLNFEPSNLLSGTIISDLSDHLPVFVIFDITNTHRSQNVSSLISCVNYKTLLPDIKLVNWDSLLDSSDINITYNSFLAVLNEKINLHTTQKVVSKNKCKNWKPWITPSIRNKIKLKDRFYKRLVKSPLNKRIKLRYLNLRNEVTNILRQAKTDYFTKSFKHCKTTSDLWNIVNTEILNKEFKKTSFTAKLESDDCATKNLEDPLEIANEFNNYFCQIGPKLASKLPASEFSYTSVSTPSNEYPSFSLKPIEEADVLAILKSFNNKKSAGLDGITSKNAKALADAISYPLCKIINKSINTGIVPREMKAARVTPIYKAGQKTKCKNYRPISILPVFSKVLEKIVNNQILNHLETNNLINKNQYGFRKNLGTSHALAAFTQETYEAFDNGHCVLGIFIDFSKAFDTINHDILLTKLTQLNFSACTVKWIRDYLTQRVQKTKVNDALSSFGNLTCGVPQGSILGPTLFLVYINDLCEVLKTLKPVLYADDTSLFVGSKDLNSITDKINADLKLFYTWCLRNRLTINFDKTSYIVFKNPQNRFQLNQNSILLHNISIQVSLGYHNKHIISFNQWFYCR